MTGISRPYSNLGKCVYTSLKLYHLYARILSDSFSDIIDSAYGYLALNRTM